MRNGFRNQMHIWLSAAIAFCSFRAGAADLFDMNVPTRAQGMGGLYSVFPENSQVVMVNPALLGFVSGINWEVVGLSAAVNGVDAVNDFKDLGNLEGVGAFNSLYGKNLWLGANGRTSLALPYFGIAAFQDVKGSFSLENPAFPSLNLNYTYDSGFNGGFAVPITENSAVGVTVKYIDRQSAEGAVALGTVVTGDTDALLESVRRRGTAYGVDLGWAAQTKGAMNSKFSLVWKDVGNTSFLRVGDAPLSSPIYNNLIAGVGTEFTSGLLDFRVGGELRHMMNDEVSFGQKVHLGTEISLPLIDLRAGINQGYMTYGFGMDFLIMQLDFAQYFQELGAYPGQTPENRVQVELRMNLSLDTKLSFDFKDGKRRRLKQRR